MGWIIERRSSLKKIKKIRHNSNHVFFKKIGEILLPKIDENKFAIYNTENGYITKGI